MHWQRIKWGQIDAAGTVANRWTVTMACLYATCAGASLFVTGFYSASFKAEFNLSQRNLELVSVSMYSGGLFSVAVGMAADRMGPVLGLRVSFLIITASLGFQYLFLMRYIRLADSYVLLVFCSLSFFQYVGSSFCTYSAIPTLCKIYDSTEHRALILGICKTWNTLMGNEASHTSRISKLSCFLPRRSPDSNI